MSSAWSDPNTFYLLNGVKTRTSEVNEKPDILGYNLEGNEKGKSADELLQQALQKVWKDHVFTSLYSKSPKYEMNRPVLHM